MFRDPLIPFNKSETLRIIEEKIMDLMEKGVENLNPEELHKLAILERQKERWSEEHGNFEPL